MRTIAIALLAVTLAGCSTTPVLISREELCQSWRHQTISKRDKLTEQTASGIEGNNDARPAWGCVRGEDRAS